jgi:hypothetical protein
MKKIKLFYGFLSLLFIIIGMGIYLMFRDLNNMILFKWLPKPELTKNIFIQVNPSIFSNILKYNIPDMLWFLSGILFLRFIWFEKIIIQKKYILCFYGICFIFEVSQLSKKIPGTFALLDLFFMGIGAFVENLLYHIFANRRLS